MKIFEMQETLHGELPYMGTPCLLIRTSGCNLCCSYCDTPSTISGEEGDEIGVEAIKTIIEGIDYENILVTGGEPLLYTKEWLEIISQLPDYTFVIETNGCTPISEDLLSYTNIHIVMDIKLDHLNDIIIRDNIVNLKPKNASVKIVFKDYDDLIEGIDYINALAWEGNIIFSPLSHSLFKEYLPIILEFSRTSFGKVKAQIQMHKAIGIA